MKNPFLEKSKDDGGMAGGVAPQIDGAGQAGDVGGEGENMDGQGGD